MLVYQRVTIMKQPLSQPLAAQHQCLDLGLQGLGLLRYAMELLVAVPATGHPATRNKVLQWTKCGIYLENMMHTTNIHYYNIYMSICGICKVLYILENKFMYIQ